MMKLFLTFISILIVSMIFFTGCTKVVPIQQNQLAVKIDGSNNIWDDRIYNGDNVKLNSLCLNNCDDVHIFESHQDIIKIDSLYAMPKSNDLDLGLGIQLKLTLNREGSHSEVLDRLKLVANRYPYKVSGTATDNQVFYTSLDSIINVDLSEAQVKSKVRPILEPFDLTDAYYNISKGGSIVFDIQNALNKHLLSINSPLQILSLDISNISQPNEIMEKKRREESLESEERIHKRQLDMKEKRMQRMQLIKLKEAANELELFEYNKNYMNPAAIAYKWTQVAESFAENGLPFAVTPDMLIPSISKLTDVSLNIDSSKAKLKERIAQIEYQSGKESSCSENNCDEEKTSEK